MLQICNARLVVGRTQRQNRFLPFLRWRMVLGAGLYNPAVLGPRKFPHCGQELLEGGFYLQVRLIVV